MSVVVIQDIYKDFKMTIITLLDVETKKKVIVRSVIDPIARIDKKGIYKLFKFINGYMMNLEISLMKTYMRHSTMEKLEYT